MYYPQPSIEIFGILVQEPVTTFTDLIVSGICFYAFYKLSRVPAINKVHLYLKFYFLSMGFATAIGGLIGHAFLYYFSFAWKLPGWLTSMVSIALVERAAIEYARRLIDPRLGTFFAWVNVIELLTFMTITFVSLNFFFVEIHSAYGLLLIVTSFNLVVFVKTRSRGSKLFLTAVGFSSIAALFFMNEWGMSPWFNHFDISHCFMAMSAWFFYLGAQQIIRDPVARIK